MRETLERYWGLHCRNREVDKIEKEEPRCSISYQKQHRGQS